MKPRFFSIFAFGAFLTAGLVLMPGGSGSWHQAIGQTQATPVVITAVAVTAQPVTPRPAQPPQGGSGPIMPGLLTLTQQDNGGTFSIAVGGQIQVLLPRLPNTMLSFDPNILQEIGPGPVPPEPPIPVDPPPVQPGPDQPGSGGTGLSSDPALNPPVSAVQPAGWLLQAIQPGVTQLTLVSQPCIKQPCPMTPILAFAVTIVVRGGVSNPPPGISETYISTAYLNKTVEVPLGQIVRLDLPFLTTGQPVALQFNSAVLQPLPGQDLTHSQSNGWRFTVINPGTSSLTVLTTRCTDEYNEGTTCAPVVLFQVTVTTVPSK